MSEELKPCPFCGGKAKLMPLDDAWTVRCVNHEECAIHVFVDPKIKGVAIKCWNTRKETTC